MVSDLYLLDKMKNNLFLLTLGATILLGLIACKKDQVSTDCVSNTTIHFSTQIKPMIDNNCVSCHSPGATSPDLSTHANIAANATLVLNSLTGSGVQLMPLGGPALNDTLISQFSCWISQGKQNN